MSVFEMRADNGDIHLIGLKTGTNTSRFNAAIKYGESIAAAAQRRCHELAPHTTFIRDQNVDIGHK
jgi:hypothetical protein